MHQREDNRAVAVAMMAAAVLSAAWPAATNAAGRFPYAAVVEDGDAPFRSGPGESYYPTGKAEPGQKVEVYHEDGDWSAVRPPRGSHSWVAAKLLELPATLRVQQGVDLKSPVAVEVAVDDAPAFIGSDVVADRDAVAVRLNAGERVWVLSAEEAGGQTWVKVAPPSGEFRWIETRALRATASKQPLADAANHDGDADDSAGEAAEPNFADADDPIDAANEAKEDGQAASGTATLAAAEETRSAAIGELSPARPSADGDEASVARRDGGQTAAAASNAKGDSATATANQTAPRGRGFWTQLQALELELSVKVAGQPKTWNFDAIRRDAQKLYDGAKSDEEYDAARYLLAKLAQFESARRERIDLEERIARSEQAGAAGDVAADAAATSSAAATRPRASLAGPPPRTSQGTNGEREASTPVTSPAATAQQSDRYDAAGRLVSIPTSRQGEPSYAIVDERNIVRQYVSPAPRVNLQPYVGRTVGITGVAGPSPDARPHVMAKRIDVLDGAVRR